MPSSYTTSLRLTLPATGELTGTWGTTVNTGITELLDSAVAGTTTISSWGGAGVAYTLSNTDGAADEARKMFIVATGAPGEAKNVICPAVSKLYFFRNDTTGGFALTLKTSGGSGIAVPAGQYKVLYCDGTNVVEAFNSLASLTLGTALAASSGGTGQSTYTTGDLLYATGSTALSKLGIGTNGQVLTSSGTAPQWSTLSGVAVTTFSAGTTGFTPSTATSGAVTLGGTLATTNGGTGLTSFTANRVFYASSTSAIGQSANLTFDGTTLTAAGFSGPLNGSVGASTPSTGAFTTLSASSTVTLSGGTANGVLYLDGSKVATSGSALTFDGTAFQIGANMAGYGSLNVARNAAAPYATITMGDQATPANSVGVYMRQASGAAGISTAGADLAFFIGSPGVGEQMRLTSTGLGIGTSSPVAKLDVNGNQSFSNASFIIGYGLNTQTGTIAGATSPFYGLNMATFTGFAGQGIGLHGYYGLLFSTNGSERMRLDSSGNLGIGTSSPAYKLDVATTARLQQGFQILDTDGYFASAVKSVGSPGNYGLYYSGTNAAVQIWAASNMIASFNAGGNVGIGTSSPGANLQIGNATAGSQVLAMANAGSSASTIDFRCNGAAFSNGWLQYDGATGVMRFATTGSERMRLDGSGNLGIGTSSPGARLDVQAPEGRVILTSTTGTNASYYTATNTGGSFFIGRDNSVGGLSGTAYVAALISTGAYPMVFGTNSAERMRLDSSGNLGLGVTPSAWASNYRAFQQAAGGGALVTLTDSVQTHLASNWYYDGANKYYANGYASRYTQISGQHQWLTAPSGTAGSAISFTQAMTLDASGNLGIGTTSPAYKLVVSNGGASGIEFAPEFSTNQNLIQSYNRSGAAYVTTVYDAAQHRFRISGTEQMRLDASGNLGLGVTPSAWAAGATALQLSVFAHFAEQSNGSANVGFACYEGGTNTFNYSTTGDAPALYSQLNGAHRWFNAPSGTAGNTISFTQAMTLDASGRLQIGTTAQAGMLTVSAPANTAYGAFDAVTQGFAALEFKVAGSNIGYFGCANAIITGGTGAQLGIRATGDMLFSTGSTERARIDSSGNLLVGATATSTNFDGKLDVAGRIHTKADSGTTALHFIWNEATTGDNGFINFGTEATFTSRGSITYNRGGGVVGFNTTSDYRAKDIIGPVQNAGAIIDDLKVYMGKMKGATIERPMMIAHEAQAVTPYAVTGEKDAVNEDGTPKYQQMDHQVLVPLLIAELQSLRARVAALESQP